MTAVQPPSQAGDRWIYHPAVDLIVGCGAWSVPLLLLAGGAGSTRTWAVAFYLLALGFNYPHYMATVYRAYHTRSDFAKYRVFTLHITAALAVVAIASHVWSAIVPWIFTLYLTWSPWHYTGQNFGLAMMFARRNGIAPTTRERRQLYAAFLASYALLFISFHTGSSSDPLIRSIGIPLSIAVPARAVLLVACGVLGVVTIGQWIARAGAQASLAPFVLVLTQATWFVVPAMAEWTHGSQVEQTRYVTGVLALMHSAQYLWITSYYARREATAEQGHWRPWAYVGTLLAGGISLFVPVPWFASYVFHTDFTQSVLIVTAVVNIHHFILDGAIWKLRDTRVAALLIDSRTPKTEAAGETRARPARALRVAALVVLVAWAALDQTRFIMGSSADNVLALTRARALNPYDSSVRRRTARALIEQKRYDEAYAEYQRFLAWDPHDGEALLNTGVLALVFGRRDEAVARWRAIPDDDPAKPAARHYLEQLDKPAH
jgi:tetratricopeptide repeat protein